jgi:pimeloyl-ACP methyl ester carboxylesterase
MRFLVNGSTTYASTGGRLHQAGRSWLILLHGSGYNHLTWILQARAFAHDGYNVLAPDLPGHFLSAGEPLFGIESQARWVLTAMDAVGCSRATICGHSMGGLIALEMARLEPERVTGLVLVATAASIAVNDKLIATAERDEQQAIRSMVSWGHGREAHGHGFTWPGGSQIFMAIDVMRLNRPGALATDLASCAAYQGGPTAAAAIYRPSLCVFARQDRMVPANRGLELAAMLADNKTVLLDHCGHGIPTERPREINLAVREFLADQSAEVAKVD